MTSMLLILGNDGLDRRQIPDMVTDRLRVSAFQVVTASAAVIGNAGNDFVAFFRSNEFPTVLWMSLLAALF
jgi:hypothetical protein